MPHANVNTTDRKIMTRKQTRVSIILGDPDHNMVCFTTVWNVRLLCTGQHNRQLLVCNSRLKSAETNSSSNNDSIINKYPLVVTGMYFHTAFQMLRNNGFFLTVLLLGQK